MQALLEGLLALGTQATPGVMQLVLNNVSRWLDSETEGSEITAGSSVGAARDLLLCLQLEGRTSGAAGGDDEEDALPSALTLWQVSLAGCLLQQLLPPAELQRQQQTLGQSLNGVDGMDGVDSVDGVDDVDGAPGCFGAWLAGAEVAGASAVACLSLAVENALVPTLASTPGSTPGSTLAPRVRPLLPLSRALFVALEAQSRLAFPGVH
ncbi:hypothetical protein FOA52_009121 [Chlamydomonas sp. UWO 241]|nr:hypothetical protein FOA52_009121 [Chlamydomonas sp. UWO 241]